MAANGWRAWLWRRHIAWRIVANYAVGALFVALAMAALRFAPSKPVGPNHPGLTPFIALLLPRHLAPDVRGLRAGFACGAFCTACFSWPACRAGPRRPGRPHELDRKSQVATKAAVQVFGHALKVAYFGQMLAGGEEVAPAAAGRGDRARDGRHQLSRRVLDTISDAQFRVWSRRLIAVIATFYLIQGVVLQFGEPLAALAASLVAPAS